MSTFITVLYFAWLRERTGVSEEAVSLPDDVRTVSDLLDHLSARGERYASAFQNRKTIRCAVNQEFAEPSASVRAGDEIAFFPPVTGG